MKKFAVVWLEPTYDPASSIETIESIEDPERGWFEENIKVIKSLELLEDYRPEGEDIIIIRIS